MFHERVVARKPSLYHGGMRRAIPALLALGMAGCFFGGGESSRVEKVPEQLQRARSVVPPAPDRYLYGPISQIKVGQWVIYLEGERNLKLAAVAAEGDGLWIEVTTEESYTRQVSARLVGPDGVVRKAYYGEIAKNDEQSAVTAQALEQTDAPAAPRLPEAGRDVGEETVTVGGRSLKAKRVSIRYEDLEGRLSQEVTLWHPDVPPLYAGSPDGGLVQRMSGAVQTRLIAFGTDALPALKLPR